MVLKLIVPEINVKPSTTKDAVITILTIDWPLSLREIFFKTKKMYGFSASYQAVYKAVKELVYANVLCAKKKKYEINIDWVKKLQSFTDIVETNYYAKNQVHNFSGLKNSKSSEDLLVLNFERLSNAEKYLYYFMKSELIKSKNDIVCFKTSHEWRPIFYLMAEYNYYSRLKNNNHKFFFLCHGNSYLENLSMQFYQKIGVYYKISKEQFAGDILVFGDYFIQMFIPEELKEKMKFLLDKKDILGLLKDVITKKTNIRIIITKNKNLASEMKKETVKKFTCRKMLSINTTHFSA